MCTITGDRKRRGIGLGAGIAPVLIVFAFSCDPSPMAVGVSLNFETNCSHCHGNEDNPAPPSPLIEDDVAAVGAHQAHLAGGVVAQGIPCGECHIVPERSDDPHHLQEGPDDQGAEVVFGKLAGTGGLEPVYNRKEAKCSNTYCHGGGMADGQHTEPVWTLVDQSQIGCDGCHGNPPKEAHDQKLKVTQCFGCHPDTVGNNGDILIGDGFHMNGQTDVLGACHTCHGTEGVNNAPPLALDGSSDTGYVGVGAHQSHLNSGTIAAAMPCEECHVVPQVVGAPNHLADGPGDLTAEVVFGGLATTDNLAPDWQRGDGTCVNTYCHGGSLTGGIHSEPIWTLVDDSQITCESCHGFPPPDPHAQNNTCELCHPRTVVSGQVIDVAGGFHINGTNELF